MEPGQDFRCCSCGKDPGTNLVRGRRYCNDCVSIDGQSCAPIGTAKKSQNVVQCFLWSFERVHPTAKSEIAKLSSEEPTILIVGPTGSGKTSILNLMAGFSLFPEGTDHTTPVPTVIRRGRDLTIRAVDENGQETRDIPKLHLDGSLVVRDLPTSPRRFLRNLFRVDDYGNMTKWWSEFWEPAFRAARIGRCVCIEATIPANWLPYGLRLVDIPGYEGWFPDERQFLHSLVLNWLEQAEDAIFVVEKTKIFLGRAIEFIRNRTKNGRGAALLVNQMDTFNPYQIQGAKQDGPQAWYAFKNHVRCRLEEEGLGPLSSIPIFFGAARTRFDQFDLEWLEKNLVLEMLGFFSYLRRIIDETCRKRDDENLSANLQCRIQLSQHLDSLRWNLRAAFSKSLELARSDFLGTESLIAIFKAIDHAVDRVELGLLDLLDRNTARSKLEQSIRSTCIPVIRINFEKAIELYSRHVRERLTGAINDLFLGLNLNRSSVYQEFQELLRTECSQILDAAARLVQASVSNCIEKMPAVSFAAVIAKTILTAGFWYSPKDAIKIFAKAKVRPRFENQLLADIWSDTTHVLVDNTLESIWDGIGPDRERIVLSGGEVFPGLRKILESAVEKMGVSPTY
ncbi:MAG: dynamin family protein [Desulfomonilaceae bacterium]